MAFLGGGAVSDERGDYVAELRRRGEQLSPLVSAGIANLFTYGMCPVQSLWRACTDLKRVAGRDIITAVPKREQARPCQQVMIP